MVMEEKLGIDDPVGAFPTHALSSVWGLIATGLFCERTEQFAEYPGLFKGGTWKFLGVQVLATVSISLWAGVTTFLQLYIINKMFGLRMTEEEENVGADYFVHNICIEETEPRGTERNENGHEGSSSQVGERRHDTQEYLNDEYSSVDMNNLQEIYSRHPLGRRKIIINNNEISLKFVPHLERHMALPEGTSNSGYHSS